MTTSLLAELISLTEHHHANCKNYANYCDTIFSVRERPEGLADIPFLPVRAFKDFELKSVSDDEIFKIMMSSGTSGPRSRIYLDRETAHLQTRTLVTIFSNTFGNSRAPMLVIDSESTVKDRNQFSARTAAVNGFSIIAHDRCFALDSDMSLNLPRILDFIKKHEGKRIFIFGFTFLVWQALCGGLRAQSAKLPLENAFLLHGGGWKKLESEKISNSHFKEAITTLTGCRNIRNYYGMVEQTGTIFMECPEGRLHASAWSDVLVRDVRTHQPLPHGKVGLIELFSTIQRSYPGHALLTEDVGLTHDASDCNCGHRGTIVEVHGRLPAAELRGCSDAYN